MPNITLFKKHVFIVLQSDDPAVQWQLNLYRDVVVKSEEPVNPEHTVSRVQSISAALFHLDLVGKETQRTKNELLLEKKKKKHWTLPQGKCFWNTKS